MSWKIIGARKEVKTDLLRVYLSVGHVFIYSCGSGGYFRSLARDLLIGITQIGICMGSDQYHDSQRKNSFQVHLSHGLRIIFGLHFYVKMATGLLSASYGVWGDRQLDLSTPRITENSGIIFSFFR